MRTRFLVGGMGLLATLVMLTASAARAEEPQLKKVTVVLKYADGMAIERILRPYLSKVGRVDFVEQNRTLSIVDEPGTVDVILKIVDRFDVRTPQLQIAVKLVQAERVDKAPPVPPELAGIAKQLGEVFSYNSFSIKDSAFIATEANRESMLTVAGESGYTVKLATHMIEGATGTVRLEFKLDKRRQTTDPVKGAVIYNDTLLATTVEMKDGETAILGASKIDGDNKALISVVTLKIKK